MHRCTAYAISNFNSEDLIVPRCGISDAFANHRKPRTQWLSRDEAAAAAAAAGALARSRLFFDGEDVEHDVQGDEALEPQARIIRGRQSARNAWPWQVHTYSVIDLSFINGIELQKYSGSLQSLADGILATLVLLPNENILSVYIQRGK